MAILLNLVKKNKNSSFMVRIAMVVTIILCYYMSRDHVCTNRARFLVVQ